MSLWDKLQHQIPRNLQLKSEISTDQEHKWLTESGGQPLPDVYNVLNRETNQEQRGTMYTGFPQPVVYMTPQGVPGHSQHMTPQGPVTILQRDHSQSHLEKENN